MKEQNKPEAEGAKEQSFSIFVDGEHVVLEASQPVTTVIFTREQAMAFSSAMFQTAKKIRIDRSKSKLILH